MTSSKIVKNTKKHKKPKKPVKTTDEKIKDLLENSKKILSKKILSDEDEKK